MILCWHDPDAELVLTILVDLAVHEAAGSPCFLEPRHQHLKVGTTNLLAAKERKKVKSLSRVRLFVTPWSPPGSSIQGILQARMLE